MVGGSSRHCSSRHSDDDSRDSGNSDSGNSSDGTRTALSALKALQCPDMYSKAAQRVSGADTTAGSQVKKERMSQLLQCVESHVQQGLPDEHSGATLRHEQASASAASQGQMSFRPVDGGSPSAAVSQGFDSAARSRRAKAAGTALPKKRKQSSKGHDTSSLMLQGTSSAAPCSEATVGRSGQRKNADDPQRKKPRKGKSRPESRSSDDHADRSSNSDGSITTKKGDSPTSSSESLKKTGSDSGSDSSSKRGGCDSSSGTSGDGWPQQRQQHVNAKRQQRPPQHQHNHQHQKAAPALRTESTQQERRRYLNRLNARKSRERKKNRQEEMRERLRFLEAETQYLKSMLEKNQIPVEPFLWPEEKATTTDKPDTPTAT